VIADDESALNSVEILRQDYTAQIQLIGDYLPHNKEQFFRKEFWDLSIKAEDSLLLLKEKDYYEKELQVKLFKAKKEDYVILGDNKMINIKEADKIKEFENLLVGIGWKPSYPKLPGMG